MAHRRLAARQSMVRQTNPDPLVVYRHIVSKLACDVCAVLSRTPVLPLPELEDCRFFPAPGRVAWVEPTQLSTSEDGRQFSWARAAMLFVASRWRPAARPSSTLSHQADTLRKRPRQAIISDAPDFLRGSAFAGAERGSFLPGSASRSEQLSVRFSNLPNPVLRHLRADAGIWTVLRGSHAVAGETYVTPSNINADLCSRRVLFVMRDNTV